MNIKSTKGKLLMSAVSLLVCMSMLVTSTFAWFTDTASSANNIIASGRLDVEMAYWADEDADGTKEWTAVKEDTALFDNAALWEPGHMEVAYLRVSNVGDLALKYQLGVNIVEQTGSVNMNGENFVLSDYLKYTIIKDVQPPFADRAAAHNALAAQTVAPIPLSNAGNFAQHNFLLPGDAPHDVALVVYMPEEVGNEANYATGQTAPQIKLGVQLTATQYAYEEDSFGNSYDAMTQFPQGEIHVLATASIADKVVDGRLTEAVQMSGDGAAAQIPQEVALAEGATALTLSVQSTTESQVSLALSESEVTASVDVHVDGVADTNTVPMFITLEHYLPTGINNGNVKLYHVEDGTPVLMTCVDTLVNHNEFTYSPLDGTVTMALASFSEVAVVLNTKNTWDGTPATAFENGDGTANNPYLIANANQLAYFRDLVDGKQPNNNDIDPTFKGKYVRNRGPAVEKNGRYNRNLCRRNGNDLQSQIHSYRV